MLPTRLRSLVLLTVGLLAVSLSASGQTRGAAEVRNIRGQVLDATTMRPLDRAFVSLRRLAPSLPPERPPAPPPT